MKAEEKIATEIVEQVQYGASISDVMQLIADYVQPQLEKVKEIVSQWDKNEISHVDALMIIRATITQTDES